MNRTMFFICLLALTLFQSLNSQTVVVPDFKVTEELLSYKSYSQPQIIANDNGDFVIFWANTIENYLTINFYNELGEKSATINIPAINQNFQLTDFNCIVPDKDFLFFWLESSDDSTAVFTKSFSNIGEPSSEVINVININEYYGKFKMNTSQDMIFVKKSGDENINRKFYFQYYNYNKNEFMPKTEITDFYNHFWSGFPDIAMNNDGNFAFTWEQEFEITASGIYFQEYRNYNKVEFNREITGYDGGGYPKICPTTDGNYIIVWDNDGKLFYKSAKYYFPDKEFVEIDANFSGSVSLTRICPGNLNDFVITWQTEENNNTKGIYAQYYKNIETIGEPILITNTLNQDIFDCNFKNNILYTFWIETDNDSIYKIFTNIIKINNQTKVNNKNTIKIPGQIELFQNYPNPFNPTTLISYNLPKSDHVKLEIFDTLGKSVRVLVNETQNSGIKNINWDGTDNFGNILSSGIYFYRLQTNSFNKDMKMILVK